MIWISISPVWMGGGGVGWGYSEKFLTGGVRLRFSIGYPWWKNIPLAKEHFLILSPFLHYFKEFELQYSFGKRTLAKIDDSLIHKLEFLGIFVKNIPLAKDFRRKIYPRLRNFCQKNTPLAKESGPKKATLGGGTLKRDKKVPMSTVHWYYYFNIFWPNISRDY